MFGCQRLLGSLTKHKCVYPGELAQLGERLLCTQEVIGSIPLFSTISKEMMDENLIQVFIKKYLN